jgi:GT2 family glycosyltransferase
MSKLKVGVVVLNFKKYEETELCVNSLLEQKKIEVSIVIVDNGSGNESINYLKQKFDENFRVHIIGLEDNVGYAKGNNVGIKYLRKRGYEYICIVNSDIILSTDKIIYQMVNGYDKKIGVILPIIENLDGTQDQRVVYQKRLISLRIAKAILIRQRIIHRKRKEKLKEVKADISNNQKYYGVQTNQYVITGSIFMLTPDFFEIYNQLFPETFLYFDINGNSITARVDPKTTIIYLYKAKLECNIVNTDVVIHKGGASTPNNMKNYSRDKEIMIAQSARKVGKLLFMSSKKIARKYNF